VLAWLAAGLAYLPWLPYQLGRLGADESYWRGTLKLGEALRKGLISFSMGETMLEADAWPWALAFLAILLVCIALLLWAGRRRSVLFLMLYLLAPAAGVLALALRVPKFNVRYLMPASPAFLLLLACGIAELGGKGRSLGRRLVAGALALFILAGFVRSDYNLYFDPAFSKADFRGVAAYLRAQRQPDEAIVLVSGHMFPVFDYYMPESERILLPAERTLSTERIVTFESAGALREGLAGKAGVWVVRWQDEVADPNGVVGLLLDTVGERQPVQAAFWQVRLEHYRLPAGARIPTEAPITTPAAVNFGGQLELAGWSQPQPDHYVLYWRALQPIAEDLSVSLRLIDAQELLAGQSDGRPAAYLYPTMRWKVGEIVPGRGALPALPGSPPGDYWLDVRVYAPERLAGLDILDAAGAPQGKSTHLGPFRLQEAGRAWDGAALALPAPLDYQWEGQVALGGMSRLPESVAAGESFIIDLGWHCLTPTTSPWRATIRLQSAVPSAPVVEQALALMQSYPSDQWRAGEWLRSRLSLRVPAGWPAGPAQVLLNVVPAGAPLASVHLGELMVAVPPRAFSAPALQMRLDARAGEGIRLAGYSLEPARPAVGEPFTLTLVWQAEREVTAAYTVFVHVLEASGVLAAQVDRQPAQGKRPTTGWVAGEYIVDAYPFDAYPFGGSLAIGLYAEEGGSLRRLKWSGPAGEPLGDALRLTLP